MSFWNAQRRQAHASRAAQSGQAGQPTGRTASRSTLSGAENGPSVASQATAGQPETAGPKLITNAFTLTPFNPAYVPTADTEPINTPNALIGTHPELPLLECPDCLSQVQFIPRLFNCAYSCVECGSKFIFSNGSLIENRGVPKPKVEPIGRIETRLNISTMEFTQVEIKKPQENVSTCLGCGNEDLAFSVRVSRFSHVGYRDIISKTFPYEPKRVYFPVFVKGRYCELCCATLRSDIKVINEGKLDEQTIGIWRDAEDREVNILMETERNTTIDTQTIKGMNREIKDNRPEMDRSNYRLMRIPGLDEPIVLAYGELKEKADPRAYNALFGKRQVNRYGRHVIEPAFNDREK